MFLGGQTVIFTSLFGRRFLLQISEVSRHPCEPWEHSERSWGHFRSYRGSWGMRARDWSVQGSAWKPSLAIPERVHESQTARLYKDSDDLPKDVFFEGGLQEGAT